MVALNRGGCDAWLLSVNLTNITDEQLDYSYYVG